MQILKISILLSLFTVTAVQSATISDSLVDAIRAAAPTDSLSVIVKLVDKVNYKSFHINNKNLQRRHYRQNLLNTLKKQNIITALPILNILKANTFKKITHFHFNNRISADIPAYLINIIANNPNVENIHLNTVYTLTAPIPGSETTPEWNLDSIGVKKLWALGYRGQGIVIANMDTGVDLNHPELKSKWRGGSNSWFDAFRVYLVPTDPLGHGTQTMGVMVGGNVSGDNIGIAPDAQWIAARIFNAQNETTEALILLAFEWFMDPDKNTATNDLPDVINASWGYDLSPNQCISYKTGVVNFEDIISRLKNEFGIAVVFGAGNSGPGLSTSVSPANLPSGYAVGATDESGNVASFSSRGPSPDCEIIPGGGLFPPTNTVLATPFPNVVAPGHMIKMADTSLGMGTALYTDLSGTSFAAPHVSGLMALLINAMPSVTVAELESVIEQTAVDIDLPGFDDNTGWGSIDGVSAFLQLPIDTDGDSILNTTDNCIITPNVAQIDTDNDGFGNACDGDFNNNDLVEFGDLVLFRKYYGTTASVADFNNNGLVEFGDLVIFRSMYGKPPGPNKNNI